MVELAEEAKNEDPVKLVAKVGWSKWCGCWPMLYWLWGGGAVRGGYVCSGKHATSSYSLQLEQPQWPESDMG